MTIAEKLAPFYLASSIWEERFPSPEIQKRIAEAPAFEGAIRRLREFPLERERGDLGFILNILGQGTTFRAPFEFWRKRVGGLLYPSDYLEIKRFEAKVATHLVYFLIEKILESQLISEDDLDYLSRLLVLVQVVSTNLEHSLVFSRYELPPLSLMDLIMRVSPSYYLSSEATTIREEEKLWTVARKIMDHHLLAIKNREEASIPIPSLLAEAFLELISSQTFKFEEWWQRRIGNDQQEVSNLFYGGLPYGYQIFENEIREKGNRDFIFPLFYLLGLLGVAKKVSQGKHNGIVYLFDHIKQVMESRGLWPTKPFELTKEDWKERLLLCLDPQNSKQLLFDFLTPSSLIREVIGRYDYRGLIFFLRHWRLTAPLVVALGFGQLGAATWEMEEILRRNGIEVQGVVGVDILPLSSIPIEEAKNYSVVALRRLSSGILETTPEGEPIFDQLPSSFRIFKDFGMEKGRKNKIDGRNRSDKTFLGRRYPKDW